MCFASKPPPVEKPPPPVPERDNAMIARQQKVDQARAAQGAGSFASTLGAGGTGSAAPGVAQKPTLGV